MKHFYTGVIVLFLIFSHQDLRAQWTQSTTMEGGSIINDIIEYKNAIYIVAQNAGVYRSNDNGVSWTRTSVTAQPNAGNFAIINGELLTLSYGTIFRTGDGTNFVQMGGINDFVLDVATDGTTLVAAGIQGIYISHDLGYNWSRASDELTQTDIAAVAVRGNVILASAKSKAGIIFKSTDLGATWTEINTGSHAVTQLAYQNSTVFMNMYDTGVFRSNDDGTTWQQVRADAVGWRIAVTPTHIYDVGRGTYTLSANQGSTWTETLDGPPSGLTIQSLFAGTSYIFTGTWGAGIYRKPLDNSAQWGSCNAGLSFHNVFDINIKDETILAGTEWAFVWKSIDEAQTWSPRRTDYLATANGNAIVRMGDDIFVASGRIYRSSDEGQTWEDKTSNLDQVYANTLATFKNKLYTHKDNEIYISSDRGDSWVKKTEGLTGTVRTIFADDEDVYVGCYQGLFRLSSDEQRWEKIDMGVASQSIGQIARLGKIVLAAEQYTGIFKSDDDGKTWENINNNIVVAMAVRNNEIYASGLTGPLYHSADSGATWADIKANLPGRVTAINFTSKHVLVGAASNGLWLRPIGEIAPPYFYFPSTLTDSTFLVDEPIVIRADQPMQTLDGNPIGQNDLEDLITVTTLDGTPVNYTATLDEDLLGITITINDVQDNTAYRITIAAVANSEGLETKTKSYTLRAISDAPPSVADISIDMPQNTTFNFIAAEFTAKYSDPEGTPLAKVKVISVPTHGTLRVSGNAVALNTELSAAELAALTYTPASDFVGTDQWDYSASDGTSYSNSAHVMITISLVTSVAEQISSPITFYPNPVDRILMITNADYHGIDQLTMSDMNGRTILLPQEKTDEMILVDFNGVPTGMYVMNIRSGRKTYYFKVSRR
jgi:photosystem II stability/assembly factor-like uncharacterized protein